MKRSFITLCLCAVCITSFAQKVTIDGITYEVNKKTNEAFVSKVAKKNQEAMILSSVNIAGQEYTVTAIKDDAIGHQQLKLKKLSIPNTVKEINYDYSKFWGEDTWGCFNLEELIVPDSPISVSSRKFMNSNKIKIVKCQNGSFPSYMIGYIEEDTPWYKSLKFNQQINSQIVQTPSQPNPAIQDNADVNINKPSSDVDVDLPSNAQTNENTFAIIFANENYLEEENVEYAQNDGEMFKEYCHKVLGLPEDNVHIRKDATLNNIRAEVEWMQQVAEAYNGQARFILFYAGHGIPDEKSATAYLLPVDGKGSMLTTGYSLADLYEALGKMPAERVTVFMDACFSGSKRGEGMLASARGVAIKTKAQPPLGKMVVFSAAQGDETAHPLKDKEHGLFTYYLLKKLKDTNGEVTYGELGSYITEQVSRKSIVSNGKSQRPTVLPSSNVASTWKNMKLKE